MNRVIFVLMLLLNFVSAMAQEGYESLLSGSKVWTMVYPKENKIIETRLIDSTTINGIQFRQKYERQCKVGEEMPTEWVASNEYVGQDGSKVYLYSGRTKTMVLDMDFSLKPGDKIGCYDFSLYSDFNFEVTAVSDTILGKISRRCVFVQVEDYPSETDVWIEGIGSKKYGISGTCLMMAVGSIPEMAKCTDGDAVIYLSETSKGDNPSGFMPLYILRDRPQTMYDLQGRPLSDPPQKGIYIHGGKKKLAR